MAVSRAFFNVFQSLGQGLPGSVLKFLVNGGVNPQAGGVDALLAQIGGDFGRNAVVNVGDSAFQRLGIEAQVHGGKPLRFFRSNVFFPGHAVEHVVAPFQVTLLVVEG